MPEDNSHAAAAPAPPALTGRARTSAADVTARAVAVGAGRYAAAITVEVAPGWYIFPPGSGEGIGLEVSATGAHISDVELTGAPGAHLSGTVHITAHLQCLAPDWGVSVMLQACNGRTCSMPTRAHVTLRP